MTEHGSRRHDGWLNQADLTDADIANLPMPDAESQQADAAGRQIVFIDGSVPDAQMFAADVRPGVVAVLLDPGQDGVQQIADWLAGHHAQNLAAIDIVAHGADGEIELGSTLLSAATIGDHLAQLAQIGAALKPGGDIQLYGCDIAQDATGDTFLQLLSQATGGANIAASSHLVGSAALGGSWSLDVNVGTIDVASPFTATALSAYPDLLNLTNNQIFFTTWNGEVGANATGNRVEQIGVSGSTFVSGSTIDLADASIDSGMTSVTSGIVIDTALNEYFVAVDNPVTATVTIQKGTISAPGSLGTFYTVPFPDSGAWNGTIAVVASLGGLALDAQHGELYFAQDAVDSSGNTDAAYTGIYKVSVSGGTPTLVTSTSAGIQNPAYLVLDTSANLLFFDDSYLGIPNNNLDAVNLTTGAVTVLKTFGTSDPNLLLQGMDINTTNNTLYLATADFVTNTSTSNAILSIPFTVSGSGSTASATLKTATTLYSGSGADQPSDIVIDPAHGIFYTTGEQFVASGTDYAGVFQGSLSGGSSLTEILSMTSVVGTTAATNTSAPQLVLDSVPVLGASGTVTAISGGSAQTIDTGATVSDQGGQLLVKATVSGALTGDTLSFNSGSTFTFADGDKISSSFSGGTLTLSGNATAADYQSALDSVTFATTSTNATPRTISWTVTDGVVSSATPTSTVLVHVPPAVTAGATVSFKGGGSAVTLDSGLTVTDASSTTLNSGTISIVGFISGDTLTVGTPGGLATSFSNGTLTLSGSASLATYQTAFDSVAYSFSPSNGDPTGGGTHTSRTIDWSVNDGVLGSGTATSTLTVVHVAPTIVAGGTVTFTKGGSPLVLDSALTVTDPDSGGNLAGATITVGSTFLTGDTLNFTNQNGITSSYNSATGVLILAGTASIANYQTALQSITYSFSGDPTNGGADTSRTISWAVNDGVASSSAAASTLDTQTACYLRGTRILTPSGEVPIEKLSIGDLVVTLFGEAKPIKWIGRRAYDRRFVAANPALLPILIRQDALAHEVPRRDLYVSQKHAMFIDDVLVPAELLVNGVSILRCDTVETVEYFHIELDAHDVILAEGAPAESFVDCDNRGMFQNAHEFDRRYPDRDAPTWTFCAPRIEDGDALAYVRWRLDERLDAFGCTTTLDPALRLMVDGRLVSAESVDDTVYRFRLEKPPGEVRIVSRSSIPAEIDAASADVRRLGVNLSRIVLKEGRLSIVVGNRDPSLVDGFHAPEAMHRWTDGDARIPEKFFARFAQHVTIEVHVLNHTLAYRDRRWPGAWSAEAAAISPQNR